MNQNPDIVAMKKALLKIDWQQVVLNGGPPCFHVENARFGPKFCLRAERWAGHNRESLDHQFVSFANFLIVLLDSYDNLEAENWCDVCLGKGDPGTGKSCICDGTGKEQAAVRNLRVALLELEAENKALLADVAWGRERLSAVERLASQPDASTAVIARVAREALATPNPGQAARAAGAAGGG